MWTRIFGRQKQSVRFQANTDTLYWNKWAQNEKKKRCNKKLEVATVFYILCIFGGENFTLTVLYVAGKLPTYPSISQINTYFSLSLGQNFGLGEG